MIVQLKDEMNVGYATFAHINPVIVQVKGGKRIDWSQVNKDLRMTEDPSDDEAIVHEVCHAHDCSLAYTIDTVGDQLQVKRMIERKYGSADSVEANEAEINVAAATFLVLQDLELDRPGLKRAIFTFLRENLRGTWNVDHSPFYTEDRFEDALKDEDVVQLAGKVTSFLLRHFSF